MICKIHGTEMRLTRYPGHRRNVYFHIVGGGQPCYGAPLVVAETATPQKPPPPSKIPCPMHPGEMLERREHGGRVWYSHKRGGETWCNGRKSTNPDRWRESKFARERSGMDDAK